MKKVLVVDDDLDMRIYVTTLLETNGYKVLTAIDGELGLKSAFENMPDLIILDVMMPNMGGITMYNILKKDQAINDIPVIMLSAIAEKTFLHSYRLYNRQEGGENAPLPLYMEKPPEPDELLKAVQDILKQ